MSESRSENIVSQAERFNAIWNFLCPDGRLFSDVIDVHCSDGSTDMAIITTGLMDINPPILDERIIQVNRAPDVRTIECVSSEGFLRISELGIKLSGRDRMTADKLEVLERIIFSEDNIGLDEIPGVDPLK
jgi:hypothetical protein